MSEIVRWLSGLGLGKLRYIFEENNIDLGVLPRLTEKDLEDLGISMGDRRRLQAGIAKLRIDEPSAPKQHRGTNGGYTYIDYPRASPSFRTAERRLLTVMFCDLVGSSALSTRLDPEDLNILISAYRYACAKPIERYEGFISRFIGDGILAYFGYPQAHEDDAERAIWAGLGIIDAVKSLNFEDGHFAHDDHLAVRIGIGTGVVVVGDIVGYGQMERDAVIGEAPNLASRLQGLATPNALVIASETKRLAGERFTYRSLGQTTLKGFDKPIEAWQVLHAVNAQSRFAMKARKKNRIVGRSNELAMLWAQWDVAKSGTAQVVLIQGEPGIGKSHLAEMLRRDVSAELPQGARYEFAQCSPHFTNTALYPIIKLLEWTTGFSSTDSGEEKLKKLESLISEGSAHREEMLALFGHLLGIGTAASAWPAGLTPRQVRERTLAALKNWFLSIAQERPLLLLIEDAQWIDPTSKLLLDRLIREAPCARLLIIITHRPEFEFTWAGVANVTQLSLSPLDTEAGQQLIQATAVPHTIPRQLMGEILKITGGIPLFIEEFTRSILESDIVKTPDGISLRDYAVTSLGIPDTIQGVLLSRIDQLGSAKVIAQLAATIGRDFAPDLLSVVAGVSQEQLAEALALLKGSQLIIDVGHDDHFRYSFRHALIQNAAYDSILKTDRRKFHLKIAEAVEDASEHSLPEFLAYHYTQAGKDITAIRYWGKAADQALTRSALFEAASHLRHALDLLGRQQPSPDRSRQELVFITQLGSALRATRGYGAPEVEELYLRARHLSQQTGDTDKQFVTEWGLFQAYLVNGKLTEACKVAAWLLEFATSRGARELLMDANLASGMANLHTGRIEAARFFLHQSILLYQSDLDGPRVLTHAQDPGVFAQCFHHWCLWFLGFPDTSLRSIEETIKLARLKGHVFSRVSALTFAIRIHQCRREFDAVERVVQELFVITRDGGYEYYEATASVHLGWVIALRDKDERGLKIMSDALDALQNSGTILGLRGLSVELAEGFAMFGRRTEALSALERAVTDGGTHCWDAEVARMHGEILAAGTDDEQSAAEMSYRRALQIANEQKALSLELRTATCLGRLLSKTNRRREAIALIQQYASKFTEGFETVDLRAAQTLLESLKGPASRGV